MCVLVVIHCFLPTAGTPGFNTSANTARMSLNSSVQITPTFPTIQLLGLEMLLHYFLGPDVTATAAKSKLILSLGESLMQSSKYSLILHPPRFCHVSISNQI